MSTAVWSQTSRNVCSCKPARSRRWYEFFTWHGVSCGFLAIPPTLLEKLLTAENGQNGQTGQRCSSSDSSSRVWVSNNSSVLQEGHVYSCEPPQITKPPISLAGLVTAYILSKADFRKPDGTRLCFEIHLFEKARRDDPTFAEILALIFGEHKLAKRAGDGQLVYLCQNRQRGCDFQDRYTYAEHQWWQVMIFSAFNCMTSSCSFFPVEQVATTGCGSCTSIYTFHYDWRTSLTPSLNFLLHPPLFHPPHRLHLAPLLQPKRQPSYMQEVMACVFPHCHSLRTSTRCLVECRTYGTCCSSHSPTSIFSYWPSFTDLRICNKRAGWAKC